MFQKWSLLVVLRFFVIFFMVGVVGCWRLWLRRTRTTVSACMEYVTDGADKSTMVISQCHGISQYNQCMFMGRPIALPVVASLTQSTTSLEKRLVEFQKRILHTPNAQWIPPILNNWFLCEK